MKTVVVTGAGRGLGFEFAKQLVARGDRVFATVRDPARATDLLALREQAGDRLDIETLDVASTESISALRDAVAKKSPFLDLLINNAGINSKGVPPEQANVKLGTLEPSGIERMIRVNAIAPLLVAQSFVDLLEASGGGKVVSISSWLGSIGRKSSGGNYGYCASKATLNMLMRAFAFDVRDRNIVSVVVNPGWVSTDMGGEKAPLSPEASVGGILRVAEELAPEKAGHFLQWDSQEHEW